MNTRIGKLPIGTLESSQEDATILIAQNDSEAIAEYIQALARYLEVIGISFPAAVRLNGLHYPFDFACFAEDFCVVKIFRIRNEDEIRQVEALSKIVDIIPMIDEGQISCGSCANCKNYNFCGTAIEIARRLNGYIYRNEMLFAFDESTNDWEEVAN